MVPQLVVSCTTYLFEGSSLVEGLGMLWAPFGVGAWALTHFREVECEEATVLVDGNWRAAVGVTAVLVGLPEEPHATSASPAVAVAEQHSSRREALKGRDIGAA
jgi:hypothetical protein